MKKLLPLFLVACLFRLGVFAAEVPATPPSDQADKAATAALKSLEDMIGRGEVGWWESQADPSIQFLNKYGGLGGDTVTALTLNQAETLWPAGKSVGGGLEKTSSARSPRNTSRARPRWKRPGMTPSARCTTAPKPRRRSPLISIRKTGSDTTR